MNIWKTFEALLPRQEIIIGRIVSVDSANNTAIVSLLSTQQIVVKGTGEVGLLYLITKGIISTEMPDLTEYNITVY